MAQKGPRRDNGRAPGVTTEMVAKLKALERENRELRLGPTISCAKRRRILPRRRLRPPDTSHDRVHRRSPRGAWGRADLRGAADRHIDLSQACRQAGRSVASAGDRATRDAGLMPLIARGPMPAGPHQPPVPERHGRTHCGCPTSPMWRPGRKLKSASPSSSIPMPGASSAGACHGRRTRASCSVLSIRLCMNVRPLHRAGLVHHSDRGSQYVSIKYTERLAEAGIEPSVGSVGDNPTIMRSPRPSTAFTRRSSSIDVDHGGPSKPSRVRHARMGGLVQPSQAAGTHRQHPSSRS